MYTTSKALTYNYIATFTNHNSRLNGHHFTCPLASFHSSPTCNRALEQDQAWIEPPTKTVPGVCECTFFQCTVTTHYPEGTMAFDTWSGGRLKKDTIKKWTPHFQREQLCATTVAYIHAVPTTVYSIYSHILTPHTLQYHCIAICMLTRNGWTFEQEQLLSYVHVGCWECLETGCQSTVKVMMWSTIGPPSFASLPTAMLGHNHTRAFVWVSGHTSPLSPH